MRNSFDMQLRKLNNELIEMGSLIETAIARAYKGLINQNIEIAKENVNSIERLTKKKRNSKIFVLSFYFSSSLLRLT